MKGLSTLIKLQKNRLDQLRPGLVVLEEQKEAQLARIEALAQELAEEEQRASEQAHLSQFFGDYNKRIKSQQQACRDEIRVIDKKIADLQKIMAEVFAELKKLELTAANIKAREAEAARRREQEMLDEVASQQHAKKQGSEPY